ncbi:hypothetical protein [Saccharothrix coeruleofusca]|uniref:Uncharacterized protein n=1 Tax=Saccharothrix coeruleofusca TaxID=33919 RepID=A0A918ATC4_9PSEU|nr:hypothetical protein [Saccharothrix coeruleofusca]GGP80958.1 hypothetical protein GCM10010185_63650 [Saccharothrix coeruleofusca]
MGDIAVRAPGLPELVGDWPGGPEVIRRVAITPEGEVLRVLVRAE